MGITKERGENGWVVRVEGEAGIAEAPQLKGCLVEAVGDTPPGGQLVLDLAAVESIDICCLQLMLAACRAAGANGAFLRVGEMSAACREAVQLAGFDSEKLPPCLGACRD